MQDQHEHEEKMLRDLYSDLDRMQKGLSDLKRYVRQLYAESNRPPAFTPRHDPGWETKLTKKR